MFFSPFLFEPRCLAAQMRRRKKAAPPLLAFLGFPWFLFSRRGCQFRQTETAQPLHSLMVLNKKHNSRCTASLAAGLL
jgi:hypothetical protein